MTRCIHCTRCVRFFQDVAGQDDFGTTLRGQDTEIGTYIGKGLDSELSGNIIDLCPVGALTSKPYAFTARPWEVKSVETIDISDSVGSNIKINFKETEILRVLPTLNDTLNEEWISDKTRFAFDGLKTQRIGYPFLNLNNTFSKIGWKKALTTFQKTIQTFKEDEVLFICGDNLDLETLKILKILSEFYGVTLVSEDSVNVNENLTSDAKFNLTFSDILDSDLCLTLGTNIRFEAALLNVRLKKQIKKGNFIKASIGLTDNCTYQNDSIGNSISTLLDIAEGKHDFCKLLSKAKKPLIILGSGVKKRLDSKSTSNLIKTLSRYCKIADENWFGINFLPLTSNFVGKAFSGINSQTKLNLANKKLLYCVGLENHCEIFSKLSETNSFIVAQTAYASPSLKQANLILPATAFTEKEGIFLNLESRFQKTGRALNGPSLARNDNLILNVLFSDGARNPKINKF
jgi:NADH-quinone oxidoreductase subunit G